MVMIESAHEKTLVNGQFFPGLFFQQHTNIVYETLHVNRQRTVIDTA